MVYQRWMTPAFTARCGPTPTTANRGCFQIKHRARQCRKLVHVIGKFRKERDVPMQADARPALDEQLDEDGKLWKQNPQRLREVLMEGSARAKIPSLTPHVLDCADAELLDDVPKCAGVISRSDTTSHDCDDLWCFAKQFCRCKIENAGRNELSRFGARSCWNTSHFSRATPGRRLRDPAGQLRGLPNPTCHELLVEQAVLVDIEVAHVLVLGLPWRERTQ